MKKTVFCFDVGRVLSFPDIEKMEETGREFWGETFSVQDFRQMVFGRWEGRLFWRDYQKGKISTDEFLSLAVKSGGREDSKLERDRLAQCMVALWSHPYQPMMDLPARLSERGHSISFLTNNNALLFSYFPQELIDKSEVTISSHQVGVSKPQAKIYEILLEELAGPSAGEVLFIDDKSDNIQGAQKLGFDTYHFPSRKVGKEEAYLKFINFLKERGIEV